MTVDEQIHQAIRKLPEPYRQELWDFIQYLLAKAERAEHEEWAALSLTSAMRDMEDEPSPYTPDDLKVRFE